MVTEHDTGAQDAPVHKRGGPPHSWTALLAAAVVAVIAAAAASYAVRSYLASRPVDLREATSALVATLEEVLLASQLPPASIERGAEKAYADADAFWTHAEFIVHVPQQLNPAGIARIVRDEMTSQHVAASDIADDGPLPALRLSLTNRPFATIHFRQSADGSAPPPAPAADPCQTVREILRRTLDAHGLTGSESGSVLTIAIPADQSHWEVAARLSSALSATGLTVIWNSDAGEVRLVLTRDGAQCNEVAIVPADTVAPPQDALPLETAPPETPETAPDHGFVLPSGLPPRVAIIVDDGGYGGTITEAFLALDPRLTLAILPNTPHCRTTAERAAAAGFEVMLHMPMESSGGGEHVFAGQIETAMPPEAIEAATRAALEAVPGARGVNNHTGSRFTQDAVAMEAFLRPLKEQGLYFIDSRTTPDSVALQTARAMGVPSAPRHVFLDNNGNGDLIRKQFAELTALARAQGGAIGICHFREATAVALAELLPTLDGEGIELVHASEMVQ